MERYTTLNTEELTTIVGGVSNNCKWGVALAAAGGATAGPWGAAIAAGVAAYQLCR